MDISLSKLDAGSSDHGGLFYQLMRKSQGEELLEMCVFGEWMVRKGVGEGNVRG
jgi:hypothetical protein